MKRIFSDLQLNIRLKRLSFLLAFVLSASLLGACGNEGTKTGTDHVSTEPSVTGFVKTKAGTFDSADEAAIVVTVDKEASSCTLYNRRVKKNYTLTFDGTTKVYDKYGSSMVMDMLSAGDVVDVTFLKSKKLLNSISLSDKVWLYDEIDEFEIDALEKRIKIDGEYYRISDDLMIFSDDKKAQLMDINSCDKLNVCGYGHDIYSIVIEQGHGYLRLKGQDYFEGGWIEIGRKIIRTVSDDMLLAVPVGKYTVRLSNGEYEGSRNVTIEKNMEYELDVSDMVQLEKTSYGTVVLVTDPSEAEVYVDGEKADTSKPIRLEYGIHQLIVRAQGYETLTQYIKVAQENATLEINLDKARDMSVSSNSAERAKLTPLAYVTPSLQLPTAGVSATPSASPTPSVSVTVTPAASVTPTPGTSPTPIPNTGDPLPAPTPVMPVKDYRVTIEAPEGVEIYVDGSYVGIVPVSFAKTEGTHVITLRKDGYVTRSYTIALDGVLRNETFSFAALEEIQ